MLPHQCCHCGAACHATVQRTRHYWFRGSAAAGRHCCVQGRPESYLNLLKNYSNIYQIRILNQFPNMWFNKMYEVAEWLIACNGAIGQGVHFGSFNACIARCYIWWFHPHSFCIGLIGGRRRDWNVEILKIKFNCFSLASLLFIFFFLFKCLFYNK